MRTPYEGSLLQLLIAQGEGTRPLHMPGHKRNLGHLAAGLPWALDVTEVPPFDNLQNPTGILQACQQFAADLWQSRRSFFLVGSSTAGILGGIRACTKRGDSILMGRNSHQAVFHAVELCGLHPVYLDPPRVGAFGFCGSVTVAQVRKKLGENPEIRLAVVTSPTYEGVLSDIGGIAGVLHEKGVPLFVDAAHGAHLDLPEKPAMFPEGAIACGADLVVHSLHKTLPALTQTGLLHVCSDRVDPDRVAHELSLFQSSSPSYPLMAAIDDCSRYLSAEGTELMASYGSRLRAFKEATKTNRYLKVFSGTDAAVFSFDPGKLLVRAAGRPGGGYGLQDVLRERFHIQVELACRPYLLGMTSLCDRPADLEAFGLALQALDMEQEESWKEVAVVPPLPPLGEQVMPIEAALQGPGRLQRVATCVGEISQEYVWQYPPGVPVLVPGQQVTADFVSWLSELDERECPQSTKGALPWGLWVQSG